MNDQNAKRDSGKIAITLVPMEMVETEGKNVQPILLPCPFCGAPANIWSWNGGTRVDCSRWYSDPTATRVHFVGIGAKTAEEAIKIWNERWEEGE